MRKYYTRPCNFYYGKNAKKITSEKKGLILAGNPNIAFDQIEIFERISKGKVESSYYNLKEIRKLKKKISYNS